MGAFDELLDKYVDAAIEDIVADFFRRTHPARSDAYIAEARAVATERGWPLIAAADWVAKFGLPYDVPVPKTGLAGILARQDGS